MKTDSQTVKILTVEDDYRLGKFLKVSLEEHGYSVVQAAAGKVAIAETASCNPDLVILDLGLPDMDGMDVIRRIREWSEVAILVLSARDRETDKVNSLDAGADDYLTKPFSSGELLARVRAAIRRSTIQQQPEPEPVFRAGGLVVDLSSHTVTLNGDNIHLTPNEYKLLATLIRRGGRIVTQLQLVQELWGPMPGDRNQNLRVHMHQLRRKLETDLRRPRYIVTETGVGYRINIE